jgi:hypothetical protein
MQEKVTYAPYCLGALKLETLSLQKPAFSLFSPGVLGLEREESLMDERFEQASACLK